MTEDQKAILDKYIETRSCKIKVRYMTRAIAKAKARRMSLISKAGRLRAYKCKYCEAYHIGHNKYV